MSNKEFALCTGKGVSNGYPRLKTDFGNDYVLIPMEEVLAQEDSWTLHIIVHDDGLELLQDYDFSNIPRKNIADWQRILVPFEAVDNYKELDKSKLPESSHITHGVMQELTRKAKTGDAYYSHKMLTDFGITVIYENEEQGYVGYLHEKGTTIRFSSGYQFYYIPLDAEQLVWVADTIRSEVKGEE